MGTLCSERPGVNHLVTGGREVRTFCSTRVWVGAFCSRRVGGGDILFKEVVSEPFGHGRVGGEDILINKGSGCQLCLKYECT